MILDPTWQSAGGSIPVIEEVMQQVEAICGNAFSAGIDDIEQVANAIDDALCAVEDRSSVDAGTIVRLASQALKAVGETQAGTRLFLFGAGVVKPLKWDIAGQDTLWALDVDYITQGNPVDCELIVIPTLHVILGSICDLWDESSGRGMLGLMHTRRAFRESLRGGLKQSCEARLNRIAEERMWDERPQVINLDMDHNKAGTENGPARCR